MGLLVYSVYQHLEMGLRLVVACICGAIIGFEREKKYKDAGLRTHIIVCCSAALMMIVSKYGFEDLFSKGDYILGTKGVDPARIAAQVISGVSFIGAGVIFHDRNNTKGLTTAAGLWAIAGVGIAIGSGMYVIGIFATVLIAIIQTLIHKVCNRFGSVSVVKFEIVAKNSDSIRDRIKQYIQDNALDIREENVEIDGDMIVYGLTVRMQSTPTIDQVNTFFENNDDIRKVNFSILN